MSRRLGWDDAGIGFALALITLALVQVALWLALLFAGLVVLVLAVMIGMATTRVER